MYPPDWQLAQRNRSVQTLFLMLGHLCHACAKEMRYNLLPGSFAFSELYTLKACLVHSVVYQTSVGIANPKQIPIILLCGFESNTLLSKLDCAWDLKGSHTIVCKTISHTGDHTILSLSPNYFPPLICFWNRQVTPSIGGKKEKSSLNGQ